MADPKQLASLRVSALNVNSTRAALMVHTVNSSGEFVSPGAGSTIVSIKGIFSADGSTSLVDSTNNSLGVTIRAGSGTEYTDGDVDATISGGAILFDNSSNTLRPVTLTRGLPVNVVAGSAASTVVTVARTVGNSSAADYMPVRLSDGSTYITPGNEYTDGSTYSTKTGPALMFDNSSNQTMRMVGTATPLPMQIRTSSGADVSDSTNGAIKVNVVAGSAAGSTIVTVSTGSVRVHQSTAADLNVTVAGYSTITSVSTGSVRVHQSTAADLAATVTFASSANSVLARLTTSSGGALEGSTAQPAGNVIGLHVRQVFPTLNSTTVQITSTHSTAIYALISSAAGLRHKVYAYLVQSTHTVPSTLIFCSSGSGSGLDHWHVMFGSGSSGVTGANLAVTPPGWIFAGVVANALNVKIEGGSSATSTVIARIGLAWFDEA